MGTVGGVTTNVYKRLQECWLEAGLNNDWRGYPTRRWTQTLPVIDCPDLKNPGSCSIVLGAVNLDIIWTISSGADSKWEEVPMRMQLPPALLAQIGQVDSPISEGDEYYPYRDNLYSDADGNYIYIDDDNNWECLEWVTSDRPKDDPPMEVPDRQKCWEDFTRAFNLVTWKGTSVGSLTPSELQRTIYFLPECEEGDIGEYEATDLSEEIIDPPVLVK